MKKMRYDLNILLKIFFILISLFIPLLLPNEYIVQIVNLIGIFALLGIGLNILIGYTGLISFGQAAFYGIGAYTTALLNTHFHLPFLAVLPISIVVTAFFGLLLAIPALKVRGTYLALITIGFGEVVRMVLVNWIDFTRGPAGIVGIEYPIIFGLEFDTLTEYYYLILFFLLIGLAYEKMIINSRTGRAFVAIREDDKVAELTGINIVTYKVRSFVISSVYAAVAGTLYAMMVQYVSPDTFMLVDSQNILWVVLIGGMGTIYGPLVGATVVTLLPEGLRVFGNYRLIIYGVLLLIVIIRYPGGVIFYLHKLQKYFAAKFDARNKVARR